MDRRDGPSGSTTLSPADLEMTLKPDDQRLCPRCGADNACGITAQATCWCATQLPSRLPLPATGTSCYCRKCAEELIAQRLRGEGPSAT